MSIVSVRVLKDELSEYLRRAEAGERVTVTRDGKPIAAIVGLHQAEDADEEAVFARLVSSGTLSRMPSLLTDLAPSIGPRPGTPLSEIIREDRDDRFR